MKWALGWRTLTRALNRSETFFTVLHNKNMFCTVVWVPSDLFILFHFAMSVIVQSTDFMACSHRWWLAIWKPLETTCSCSPCSMLQCRDRVSVKSCMALHTPIQGGTLREREDRGLLPSLPSITRPTSPLYLVCKGGHFQPPFFPLDTWFPSSK